MGAFCSTADKEGDEPPEGKAQDQVHIQSHTPRRLHKMPQKGVPVRSQTWRASINSPKISTEAEYFQARAALIKAEKATAFDAEVIADASEIEIRATKIVQGIRNHDWDSIYSMPPSARRAKGMDENNNLVVERTAGEHFLTNVDLINQTELFKVAKQMPKGAHLHVHFNSCLSPKFLIREARDLPTMWINSSHSLLNDSQNYKDCRIQFNVFTDAAAASANTALDLKDNVASSDSNIFSQDYAPVRWMKYKKFQQTFDWTDEKGNRYQGIEGVEDWLEKKMIFNEEEVHDVRQTSRGIWERFNYRTQMMKGLFAYESAYRNYTRACIQDFVDDNIQYAEVRPNFMQTNQLKLDDGSDTLNNERIMEILDDGVKSTLAEINQEGRYFADMKVIYCTPRSFPNNLIKASLDECIKLKKRFSHLICGFDLVGHEEMGSELSTFIPEFLQFRKECNEQNLDIPFLFHCGETLQVGDKVDSNLFDAVLLNCKRIGHGYALARHPLLMKMFKEKNIAIESCPISNEILGLTSVMAGHHLPILLANDVPCTINSDNATFYQSSLSHDFYQVMIGSEDMSLLGWKQLAKWSLEHSCMDDDQKKQVTAVWQQKWDEFCQWIIDNYADLENYGPHKDDRKC